MFRNLIILAAAAALGACGLAETGAAAGTGAAAAEQAKAAETVTDQVKADLEAAQKAAAENRQAAEAAAE
jgi:hypothetical protein